MNKITQELLLHKFGNLLYAFSYGSGAFPQIGYNYQNKIPMIDLIIVPKNTYEFHFENIKQNKFHYSKIARFLGPNAISWVQKKTTGVYFNTNIILENNIEIKYGIADYEMLKKELSNWNSLFLAGRMQKPLKIIIENDKEITNLIKENRKKAVFLPHKTKKNS